MRKVWKIIKREFKTAVLTKGFIIGTVLGPIIILGFIFGPAYFMSLSSDKPMTFRVVDYSGEIAPEMNKIFSDTLKNGQPRFIFSEIDPQEYEARKKDFQKDVEEGGVDAILVIPADIMKSGQLTYVSKSIGNIDIIRLIRERISNIVNEKRLLAAGMDPSLIKELTQRVKINTVKLVKGKAEKRGFDQEFVTSFVFLMMLYMTILMYGNSILRSVIEEKTSRIIEVLLSSTDSFKLMLGKLLGVGSVGLVQYLIWALMGGIVILGASSLAPAVSQFISISPIIFLYFILFFIIGFFTFSTLYMAVGAMCSDMQDAQSLSAPVTFLIIIPFIVSMSIIKNPSTDMAFVLSLIPFFTPMTMFMRIITVMPPFWQIALSIFTNVLGIVVIMWGVARIYRVGILMYGKRATLPEIVKWLRYR